MCSRNAPEGDLGDDLRITARGPLCQIGPDGEKLAQELVHGLTEFKIFGVGRFLSNPMELLRVLSSTSTVTRLDLQHSQLTDDQLVLLTSMPQLEELVLPEITSDEGLRHISGLIRLRHLTQIRGSEDSHDAKPISDVGLGLLTRLVNLETLAFSWDDISDEGYAQLKHFPRLNHLCVGSRAVTDKGIEGLSRLRNLRDVSFRATSITDQGVATLAKNHPELERLNLCHTSITSACVSDLAKLTHLRWLGVYETPLNGPYPSKSDATCALEKQLPQCEVLWID